MTLNQNVQLIFAFACLCQFYCSDRLMFPWLVQLRCITEQTNALSSGQKKKKQFEDLKIFAEIGHPYFMAMK